MGLSKSKSKLAIKEDENLQKVLILGSSHSGKSTFFRSFQRCTIRNFDDDKFEYNLQLASFWIIERIYYLMEKEEEKEQLRKIVEHLDEDIGNIFESTNDESFIKRIQDDPACASLLVKLWNCPFFREFYESKWANNSIPYENVEDFIQRIERKKRFDPFSLIRLRSCGITSYKTIWKNSNVEFLDSFGKRSERRKWVYCIENIKILIYAVSLSEFNLVDDYNIGMMNDSLEMIGKLFGNRLLSDARKVIIFTKPDILVKKLRKRIEYNRKINSVVRPELEVISSEHERIVINSIVSEYLERVSLLLDSYHIVNSTSEEEVKSVIELIFDNSTTPFISPCLLPIANRMITTLHNIYMRNLLTDIQIITDNNELSP